MTESKRQCGMRTTARGTCSVVPAQAGTGYDTDTRELDEGTI